MLWGPSVTCLARIVPSSFAAQHCMWPCFGKWLCCAGLPALKPCCFPGVTNAANGHMVLAQQLLLRPHSAQEMASKPCKCQPGPKAFCPAHFHQLQLPLAGPTTHHLMCNPCSAFSLCETACVPGQEAGIQGNPSSLSRSKCTAGARPAAQAGGQGQQETRPCCCLCCCRVQQCSSSG